MDDGSIVDFTDHFTTNLCWSTMDELRKWVRKTGYELNMVITTKCSRKDRDIILHCERSGKYRSGKKKIDGMSPKKKPESERASVRLKKSGCPFTLLGKFIHETETTAPGWILMVVNALDRKSVV